MPDTNIFVDNTARDRMANWFATFREALPFPTESRIVETDEGSTHVLIAGPSDAPPLVVLHGALATSAHILPELGDLVTRHRVYAIDVIGQSVMSADKRIDVAGDAYGRWLTNVCKALELKDGITLFGVSWGGFVSIRAACVAPELVKALILFVPAGVVSGSFWSGFVKLGWPMLMYRFSPNEKRLARVAEAMLSSPDDRWTKYFGEALLAYKLDMRVPPLTKVEDTSAIKAPVLVFGADDDVSFPGAALTTRAKELFPHAEIELLENCKHCPPTTAEFRAKTASRVTAFLQQHRS
jgi:2-hydroxy-6-oxonona-2,4-dienedioate hydrolase